jgi:hypothetical protein
MSEKVEFEFRPSKAIRERSKKVRGDRKRGGVADLVAFMWLDD